MSRTLLMGLIIGLGASLGGCGVVSSFNRLGSDYDMGKSEAAYKQCLADHPGNAAQACEAERLAYQADVQTYSARTGQTVSIATTGH